MLVWDIELINVIQGQTQKVMLIFPSNLRLRELGPLGRSRRGISDFGYQICGGSFRDTVHEHTNKWDFQDDGECERETE